MYSCLSKVPIFQHLTAAEMAHVHQFIRPKTYQKGEFIQHAGDTTSQLLVLNRGSAKILRTSRDGSQVTLRQLQPGDYIGDTAVFGDAPADNDTVATTDASFCTLTGDDLHELLRSYPTLSIKIIADLSVKLKNSEAYIESLSLRTAQDRVYEALVSYADGKATFTLTQPKKDIAGSIGMQPETFSRSLRQLQQKGLIAIDGKTISFPSAAK